MKPIEVHAAVVVALADELRAVLRRMRRRARADHTVGELWTGVLGGKNVAVVRTGMGRQHATKAVTGILEKVAPACILIMGFCGGISEWAGPADLVLADYVIDWPDFPGTSDVDRPQTALHPDAALLELAKTLEIPGIRVLQGGILSVGSLVPTMMAKGYHGPRAARCRALDMESGPLALAAGQAGIPWLVVRAVTDTLDEDLPMPFDQYLSPHGEIDRLRVLITAFRRPYLFPPLLRLARQSARAARNMAYFAERLVQSM